jgi:hypothetical protein
VRRAVSQALHLQAGAQVAPGRQRHVEPHLQAGPQTHVVPLVLVGMESAVEFGSGNLAVEFI